MENKTQRVDRKKSRSFTVPQRGASPGVSVIIGMPIDPDGKVTICALDTFGNLTTAQITRCSAETLLSFAKLRDEELAAVEAHGGLMDNGLTAVSELGRAHMGAALIAENGICRIVAGLAKTGE